MYAYIENGIIIRAMIDLPPELEGLTVAEQEAAGYYAITGPPKPDDDPSTETYWEPNVALENGRPVVIWIQRAPLDDTTMEIVCAANTAIALDLDQWASDVDEINDFLDDPDIQRVLDQPNNTPLATNDLNRALKALVRQARRNANLSKRISQVVVGGAHPEALLADID